MYDFEVGISDIIYKPQIPSVSEILKEIKANIYRTRNSHLGEYRLELQYGTIYITKAPTCNCQLATIAQFNVLLEENSENIKKIIKFIYTYITTKPLLLIDVRNEHCALIEKIFTDEYIVSKTEYTSSNDSEMVIYILNIQKFTNHA